MSSTTDVPAHDVIVVGSGIAGLVAAMVASEHVRVAVITKGRLDDGCSRFAQGGIAAAVAPDDEPRLHLGDTIAAGRGLCDERAARVLVEEGPRRVRQLIDWGVGFDTQDGELLVGREAAHSRARILHARGDATGWEIENALIARVRAAGVTIIERHLVTRLLLDDSGRCAGVDACDTSSAAPLRLHAAAVVLASGGAGRLWRRTTNPEPATGDGVAIAWEAGAEVAGMEFVQFHPTALALPGAPPFLISEAVRGEGARVVNERGERFLFAADPRGELAGRDVVAAAIWRELQEGGASSVFLDCSPLATRAAIRFPTIHRTCLALGIDITREAIPVAPAAHYCVGGVRTDLNGATGVDGLFAAGEVASTGVHGANRLASNSLLESVVFAHRAASQAMVSIAEAPAHRSTPAPPPDRGDDARSTEAAFSRLREAMWEGAGLVRSAGGLAQAASVAADVGEVAAAGHAPAARELALAATTASLVCAAATSRAESRGAHIRSDHPGTRDEWLGTLIMHKQRGSRLDRNARPQP